MVLLSLPLGVWEGLRFVIVALPGLLSYSELCPGHNILSRAYSHPHGRTDRGKELWHIHTS